MSAWAFKKIRKHAPAWVCVRVCVCAREWFCLSLLLATHALTGRRKKIPQSPIGEKAKKTGGKSRDLVPREGELDHPPE